MSRKFLSPIGVLSRASDPTGAANGDLYFNTTTNCYKQYTGSAWVNLVAQPTDGVAGGRIFTGDTAPSSPTTGDLWIDSTNYTALGTSANTINTVVQRDNEGGFSAGAVSFTAGSTTAVPLTASIPAGSYANILELKSPDFGGSTPITYVDVAGNLNFTGGQQINNNYGSVNAYRINAGDYIFAGNRISTFGAIYGGFNDDFSVTPITTATALDFYNLNTYKITPGANVTLSITPTYTLPLAGQCGTLIILTSGTANRTITFGTGFKTGTALATGTVSGKYFVINYISDGNYFIETSRTAAI
jgi:hypothetical protein